MAYTKQNFTDGQVLKAEHLNAMEQGIADAHKLLLIVAYFSETQDENQQFTCDKYSWQDILTLVSEGRFVIGVFQRLNQDNSFTGIGKLVPRDDGEGGDYPEVWFDCVFGHWKHVPGWSDMYVSGASATAGNELWKDF